MKNSRKNLKRNTRRRSDKPVHTKRTILQNPTSRRHSNRKRYGGESQRWTHPDIAKYLKISKSKNFGRYIKAAQSIEVAKVAISTAPFACGMSIDSKTN